MQLRRRLHPGIVQRRESRQVFAAVPVVGRALMAAPVIADRIDVMETGPDRLPGSANQLLHAPQVQRPCLGA